MLDEIESWTMHEDEEADWLRKRDKDIYWSNFNLVI